MAGAVEILEGADAYNASSKLTRTRVGLMVSESYRTMFYSRSRNRVKEESGA